MSTASSGTVTTVMESNITTLSPFTTRAPMFSDGANVIIVLVLFVTAILGFFMNGSVLIIFYRKKELRSPTNMFIISMAFNDLMMSILGNPFAAVSNLHHRWIFGDAACVWYGFIMFFLGLNGIYHLTAIAFDRYIVIAKPLLSSKITTRVAALAISVCWFGAFLWSVFPVFGWSSYVEEGEHSSCSINWISQSIVDSSYIISIFIFCFFLPILLVIFSYFHVYMTVRTIAKSNTFGKDSKITKKNEAVERKMAKMVIIMITVFFGSWSPYAIVSMFVAFGDGSSLPAAAIAAPAIIAKSAMIWNPIIYVLMNVQFRSGFAEMYPCFAVCANTDGGKVKVERPPTVQDNIGDDNTEMSDVRSAVPPAPTSNILKVAPAPDTTKADVHTSETGEQSIAMSIARMSVRHKVESRTPVEQMNAVEV
uniref:Ciliary opsin n=1 Tax=Terebratalia transversa TaxID=34513 RepID=F1D8E5_TERTR|nr:ciliary opsin [Terebratalia transversa]